MNFIWMLFAILSKSENIIFMINSNHNSIQEKKNSLPYRLFDSSQLHLRKSFKLLHHDRVRSRQHRCRDQCSSKKKPTRTRSSPILKLAYALWKRNSEDQVQVICIFNLNIILKKISSRPCLISSVSWLCVTRML